MDLAQVRSWHFSDLVQCPLLRRCWGLSGHRGFMSTRPKNGSQLPVIDQIAICSAGADAQRLLGAPTNEIAAFSDMVKIGNLIDGYDEAEGEYLRYAGYRRSHELLELHRATVERLPAALAEQGELDQNAIERIIAG